ncbi:MAG: metallophosphoesterase [Syntrophales bacterium]|nr:metallophosphoesterase [Syntrophales bacterium]
MEIVYLSDIHDDFDSVRNLLNCSDADLYIVSGDLLDRPFFTEEATIRYRQCEQLTYKLRQRLGLRNIRRENLKEILIDRKDISDKDWKIIQTLEELTIRGRRAAHQKYKVLESVLRMKKENLVLCLPGNHDMDLQYTSLHTRDLHRHWYQVGHFRIAGYGGADTYTPGIPSQYIVKYRGDQGKSEMLRFFNEIKPDIVVTHKPPFGILDFRTFGGESGSLELLRFCEENSVLLCLSGHIHEHWGFEEHRGTVFLNPSNFGTIVSGGKLLEGGVFFKITVDEHGLSNITLAKLENKNTVDMVNLRKEGSCWQRKVLNREHFGEFLRRIPISPKESSVPTIRQRLIKNMNHFFKNSQENDNLLLPLLSKVSNLEHHFDVSIGVEFLGEVRPFAKSGVVFYFSGSKDPSEIKKKIYEETSIIRDVYLVDVIDLNEVKNAIQKRDYEDHSLLLFAAYHTFGTTIKKGQVEQIEDHLERDGMFKGEIEGSGNAYLEIFINSLETSESLKDFYSKMESLGITVPESFQKIIAGYYNGPFKKQNQESC